MTVSKHEAPPHPGNGSNNCQDFLRFVKDEFTDSVTIQLRGEQRSRGMSMRGRLPVAISQVPPLEIASGMGILPVILNRQAGSLSHHSLLAMTIPTARPYTAHN
jgi:hypothetical protein